MEYLPFRIAGRDFVVDASRVKAIIPFDRLQDISAHRTSLVLLVDLRERLGLPPIFYGRHPCLVVVETSASESGQAGFEADYVSDVIIGNPSDCHRGKLRAPGRSKWMLDADSLAIAR